MPDATDITFRPATLDDLDLVFDWANDPITRAASFRSDPIPYEDHVAWYTASLTRPTRHLLLALYQNTPVAFLRFDHTHAPPRSNHGPSPIAQKKEPIAQGPQKATISINVAPHARGKGLGTATLKAATNEAGRLGYAHIIAYIRPSNAASVHAFTKAGYTKAGEESVQSQPALRYERPAGPTHG